MNLSARDRRAIKLGIIGLAIIIAARYVVIPWVEDWTEARNRAAYLSATLDEQERGITRVLAQRSRLARHYGAAINEPLVSVEEARIDLFDVAQGALVANGFELSDYRPQRERRLKEVPGVEYVPLQVRGKCKLKQLAACLDALRSAGTLAFVDRISVTNSEKKPGDLEVTLLLATLAERKGGGL